MRVSTSVRTPERQSSTRMTRSMPFKFTGTLEKVQVTLGSDQLTSQQEGELERLRRDFALRMQ